MVHGTSRDQPSESEDPEGFLRWVEIAYGATITIEQSMVMRLIHSQLTTRSDSGLTTGNSPDLHHKHR